MTDLTKEQMLFIVPTIIKIRRNKEKTDGFGAPCVFSLELIENKMDIFDLSVASPKDYLVKALTEIKDDTAFIRKHNISRDLMFWEDVESAVKIFGYDTDLLFYYLKYRLYKQESIFGRTTDERHRPVFSIFDFRTLTRVSDKDSTVFSVLLENFGEFVSYKKLFNEIERRSPNGNDFWARYDSESKKKDFVNDSINNLRKRLRESATQFLGPDEVIIKRAKESFYALMK